MADTEKVSENCNMNISFHSVSVSRFVQPTCLVDFVTGVQTLDIRMSVDLFEINHE